MNNVFGKELLIRIIDCCSCISTDLLCNLGVSGGSLTVLVSVPDVCFLFLLMHQRKWPYRD